MSFKDLFRSKHKKYVTVKPKRTTQEPKALPDGLWVKCDSCRAMLYNKDLNKNYHVCPKCGYHFRIGGWQRIEMVLDKDSFEPLETELRSVDPLGFPGYEKKREKAQEKTRMDEALVVGKGTIAGIPIACGSFDFGYMGGSMGSVVGERITRLFEHATAEQLPVIIFVAGGGGARMHEGIFSLFQMAKTSQAVERHNRAGLLYVSVLTHPTMGGVYASFATLADILIAEPGALIGFAGPRIVEETIRQKLPEGFQRSEFSLEHGMLDRIVSRTEMHDFLARVLKLHRGSGVNAQRSI